MSKKQKTLQTLSAEAVLQGINPVYHPILLRTLFEDMGYREHIHRELCATQKLLWKTMCILDDRSIDISHENIPDTVACPDCDCDGILVEVPYASEMEERGSLLIIGRDAKRIQESLARTYKKLQELEKYYTKNN